MITFELLNNTTGDKFEFRFRRRKIDKPARIYQRRTTDAHVYLFCPATEKVAYIITQLRTSDDRVITEYNTFAVDKIGIRNQFHLCDQLAQFLRRRSETTRPCGCIFHNTSFIRNFLTFGITQSHTDTRVGNGRNKIGLHIVFFSHLATALKPHTIYILTLVLTHGVTVIYPQERANLHFFIGFTQLGKTVGRNEYNLPGSHIIGCFITEIGKTTRLRRYGIPVFALTHEYRCATVFVAGSNDTVLGKEQHRARSFELVLHIFYAVDIILPFGYKRAYQLRLVGNAITMLAKMMAFIEQFFFKFR